jgi:hypothetical protein
MNDESEQRDPIEERALLFEDMAKQIRLNKDYKFGGAFLLVPPGEGEPFSSLMLRQEEAPIFWSTIKTLVQVAEETMGRPQAGFGGRR